MRRGREYGLKVGAAGGMRSGGGSRITSLSPPTRFSALSLSQVTHSCPLHVMEALVQQVESYPNQIEPVVEALRFMTPLSLDVLTYVILQVDIPLRALAVNPPGCGSACYTPRALTYVPLALSFRFGIRSGTPQPPPHPC